MTRHRSRPYYLSTASPQSSHQPPAARVSKRWPNPARPFFGRIDFKRSMAMIIALALVMYFGFNNGLGFPRYDPAFAAMLAAPSTAPSTAPAVRPGQGAASSAAPSISNSTMPMMAPAMTASMNTAPGFWNQQYLRQMRSLQQQAMGQQTMAHHAMAQQAQQALAQQALAAPMPLRVPLRDRTNVTAVECPPPKKGKKERTKER